MRLPATPDENGEISSTIRFPAKLYRKLLDLAHARNKSVNETLCATLKAHIEEHEDKLAELPVSPATYLSHVAEAYSKEPLLVANLVADLQKPKPKRPRKASDT